MTEATLYELRRDVAWITLNQPEKRNALSDDIIAGLLGRLRAAIDDARVRAIVITGAGTAFCAGADLK
ncbi:MAG: enoyl-CoA hydratase-related protein, partial [Gaiellaceae bacterium]